VGRVKKLDHLFDGAEGFMIRLVRASPCGHCKNASRPLFAPIIHTHCTTQTNTHINTQTNTHARAHTHMCAHTCQRTPTRAHIVLSVLSPDLHFLLTQPFPRHLGRARRASHGPRPTQMFNNDISKWNTSRVSTLESAFQGTAKFNAPIGDWRVSQVSTVMQRVPVTVSCQTCRYDVATWKNGIGSTRSLGGLPGLPTARHCVAGGRMAHGDTSPLSVHSIHSQVTSMCLTFNKAVEFNQPIGSWDTASNAF